MEVPSPFWSSLSTSVKLRSRHSLVLQWLGFGAFPAGAQVQSLVGELRSHEPHVMAKKMLRLSVYSSEPHSEWEWDAWLCSSISAGTSVKWSEVKVKVAQSCPALCDPIQSMEFSRPEYWNGQPDIPFSRGSSWLRDQTHISWGSCIAGRFFTTESLGKQWRDTYLQSLIELF